MNAIETSLARAQERTDPLASPITWETAARHWPSGELQSLTCCRVMDETHDVKTFEFRPGDGVPVRFEPGQFMTVSATVNGQAIERCYTISSPPTRPYLVAITVKRVPGGVMSNWLHDTMRPGAQLNAFGPSGAFTSTASSSAKTLYLSAGSGVTPVMSMTRAGIDLGLDRDVVFVHSARTPADIAFRNELARLGARSPRLRVVFVCESMGDETGWTGDIGRLSLDLLARHVPDYAEREVFTCGPAGYMGAVRALLREGGHDPRRYHQESFDFSAGIASEPPSAPTASDAEQDIFTVKLSKSAKTFTMTSSETVLGAARRAGVAIPSSCSQGVCGTCKTRLLDGTVDMKHNGGIREREVQKGFRLLCCSRPRSDLTLEL